MSDEEREDTETPALVSEAYNSSSAEDPSSDQEGALEIEETEHSDVLSYETVSETPLELSSEPLEESSNSQEIFPQASRDPELPSQGATETSTNAPATAADDLEGKFLIPAFVFLLAILPGTGQVPIILRFFKRTFS